MLERLKNLYCQDRYNDTWDRCDDCENLKSYYFDEYDSDSWCDLQMDRRVRNCIKFKKESGR